MDTWLAERGIRALVRVAERAAGLPRTDTKTMTPLLEALVHWALVVYVIQRASDLVTLLCADEPDAFYTSALNDGLDLATLQAGPPAAVLDRIRAAAEAVAAGDSAAPAMRDVFDGIADADRWPAYVYASLADVHAPAPSRPGGLPTPEDVAMRIRRAATNLQTALLGSMGQRIVECMEARRLHTRLYPMALRAQLLAAAGVPEFGTVAAYRAAAGDAGVAVADPYAIQPAHAVEEAGTSHVPLASLQHLRMFAGAVPGLDPEAHAKLQHTLTDIRARFGAEAADAVTAAVARAGDDVQARVEADIRAHEETRRTGGRGRRGSRGGRARRPGADPEVGADAGARGKVLGDIQALVHLLDNYRVTANPEAVFERINKYDDDQAESAG
jgi:hypothetical protein